MRSEILFGHWKEQKNTEKYILYVSPCSPDICIKRMCVNDSIDTFRINHNWEQRWNKPESKIQKWKTNMGCTIPINPPFTHTVALFTVMWVRNIQQQFQGRSNTRGFPKSTALSVLENEWRMAQFQFIFVPKSCWNIPFWQKCLVLQLKKSKIRPQLD